MKFIVTINKWGSMEIDAETEDEARTVAEDLESEGAFEMEIEVIVAEMTTKPWVVVVHAGYENERETFECYTYDDAYCAMHENFTRAEQLELNVDIMMRLPDGTLTTEY